MRIAEITVHPRGRRLFAREDVALADIEAVAGRVVAEEAADAGRAKRMLERITEQKTLALASGTF